MKKLMIEAVDDLIENGVIKSVEQITGKYYTSGDGTGLGAELSEENSSADITIKDKENINLGINEQIVLPSGYYTNELTVSNNVKNNGSLEESEDFQAYLKDKSAKIPDGYYTGINEALDKVGSSSGAIFTGGTITAKNMSVTGFTGTGVGGSGKAGKTTKTLTFSRDTYWLVTHRISCTQGHRDGNSESDPWVTDSTKTAQQKITLIKPDGSKVVISNIASGKTATVFSFVEAGSKAEIYTYFSGGNHNTCSLTGTYIYQD